MADKSYFNQMALEAALDAGKTVLVCERGFATKRKRKKHLTSIEHIEYETMGAGIDHTKKGKK